MRSSYTLLIMSMALLLEVLAAVLSSTEVVPPWRAVRDGLSLGLVLLSLASGLFAWTLMVRKRGLTWLRGLGGGLLLLLLAAGGWLVLFLKSTDDFGLGGRRLVQSMNLSGARGKLYVYEYEGVPDGFEGTVVMLRAGYLPVMRPLAETRYRITGIEEEGELLRMHLEGAPENAALQCNLTTGACW